MEEACQGQPCETCPLTQQTLPKGTCGAHDAKVYQQVLDVVTDVLLSAHGSKCEESAQSITMFILDFSYPTGHSHISQYLFGDNHSLIFVGRVFEAFAHWARKKTRMLDGYVAKAWQSNVLESFGSLKIQLEQACREDPHGTVIAGSLHTLLCDLMGRDADCLARDAIKRLLNSCSPSDIVDSLGRPIQFLTSMAINLEAHHAHAGWVAMRLYDGDGFCSIEESTSNFMELFSFYTVDTCTGALQLHENRLQPALRASEFQLHVVNTFGALMQLLNEMEHKCAGNMHAAVFAVDCQGVNLSRHGELCLMQLMCFDEPSLVHVIDVHALGGKAFTLHTPKGTSMERVLEDGDIRKVWFDPRNDVDALYHQFGVLAKGIFDLQLADVVDRRNRGFTVHHVRGLHDCLSECSMLSAEQKAFAEKINIDSKRLYDPKHGGAYEAFQQRPLHRSTLVYAAHRCWYMIHMCNMYMGSLDSTWVDRVMDAGMARELWCLWREYRVPGTEAPDI